MPSPLKTSENPDERRAYTEPARLARRFKSAEKRIRELVSTDPKLTEAQRAQLAGLLLAGPERDPE